MVSEAFEATGPESKRSCRFLRVLGVEVMEPLAGLTEFVTFLARELAECSDLGFFRERCQARKRLVDFCAFSDLGQNGLLLVEFAAFLLQDLPDRLAGGLERIEKIESERPERDVGLLLEVHRGAVGVEDAHLAEVSFGFVLVLPVMLSVLRANPEADGR